MLINLIFWHRLHEKKEVAVSYFSLRHHVISNINAPTTMPMLEYHTTTIYSHI